MNDPETVEELRKAWRLTPEFGLQVGLYYQLLDHPDCTWQDLLDGLQTPGLVREAAAVQLHSRLQESGSELCFDQAYWRRELERADKFSSDRIRERSKLAIIPRNQRE